VAEHRPGFCVWLTGLPCAGKTSIARQLAPVLSGRGLDVELLDGDEVRRQLSPDLGFDRASREVHADRVAYLAGVLVRHGVVPIVALISPYASSRARAREEIGRFAEVYVATPLEVCEARDAKGLYRRARAGEIRGFTGVDDPYEPPERAEIRIDTVGRSPGECARQVADGLVRLGFVPAA